MSDYYPENPANGKQANNPPDKPASGQPPFNNPYQAQPQQGGPHQSHQGGQAPHQPQQGGQAPHQPYQGGQAPYQPPQPAYQAPGQPPQPAYQTPGQPPYQVPYGGGGKQRPKKSGKFKNAIKWIIPTTIALIFLIIAFIAFPAKLKFTSEDDPTTFSNKLNEYEVSVSSNQWVKGIRYALNPRSPLEDSEYRKIDSKGSPFKKTFLLEELRLQNGNNSIYIKVDTLFGPQIPQKLIITKLIGRSSRFLEEALEAMDDSTSFINNELIVASDFDLPRERIESLLANYDGEIVGEIPTLSRYQCRFDNYTWDIADLKAMIEAEQGIRFVEYNFTTIFTRSIYQPNDAEFDSWSVENPDGNNWGLEAIKAPVAWKDNRGSNSVNVGILDGAIQYDHEDLLMPLENVYLHSTKYIRNQQDLDRFLAKDSNFVTEDFAAGYEHGTHVTGTIGALTDNKLGVAGINNLDPNLYFYHFNHYNVDPAEQVLYPFQSPLTTEQSTFDLMVAIATLVESDCRVINFSMGAGPDGGDYAPWIEYQGEAYGRLCEDYENMGKDFLFVKAAGNETVDSVFDPISRSLLYTEAGRRHTAIVASIENVSFGPEALGGGPADAAYAYNMSYFSNYGDLVTVAAPGTDIFSTWPGNTYTSISGTSMASPMVSGVASIIYSVNPNYTSEQVKQIMINETDTYTVGPDGIIIPVVNLAMANLFAQTGQDPILLPRPDEPADQPSEEPTPDPETGTGTASGLIVDALTGDPVPDASLKFYSGSDANSANLELETSSDAEGKYKVELATGEHAMFASKAGYADNSINIIISKDTESKEQNCTLSPQLAEGEVRFVLTWGETPEDLDSHLVGPTSEDPASHVYWWTDQAGDPDNPDIALDLDDTESYGPETITIYKQREGTYTYYVHDYTNSWYEESSGLANSGAKVTVYMADGTSKVFNVPNKPGTLWKVCTLENGLLKEINTMDYEMHEDDVPNH